MRWRSLIPTEHQEQVAVMQWANSQRVVMPELSLLYAIPNGGERPKVRFFKNGGLMTFSPEALRLKAEGVKPGVPDLNLPISRHGFHSLYIEVKRLGQTPTMDQEFWHVALRRQGHAVIVCQGADEAIRQISGYLSKGYWIQGSRTP